MKNWYHKRLLRLLLSGMVVVLVLILLRRGQGFVLPAKQAPSSTLTRNGSSYTVHPGNVLAAQDSTLSFNINVPTNISENAFFDKDIAVKGKIIGVLNGVIAGSGVTVQSGLTPRIDNTGVLSLGGKTGNVLLEAGSGITIDGLKISASSGTTYTAGSGISVSGSGITNTDTGSSQHIFKNIAVLNQNTITADSNTDTLIFASGSGILLTSDATTKQLTIAADGSALNISGFEVDGSNVILSDSSRYVGIGTTAPSEKLEVNGNTVINGSIRIVNGIDNHGGGITNTGAITDVTGFTSSGTITLSGLSSGIVHTNSSGVLSASTVDLTSGDVTGVLPVTNGGTGLTAYNTGDLVYASGTDTLGTLGVGATGQILTISAGGVPTWASVGGGSGGLCSDCLINDPGSSQTLTPTASTATGLSIKQAASGSVDIFNILTNDGTSKYFRVDSAGKVRVGNGSISSTAPFIVNSSTTDAITITPPAIGSAGRSGNITSLDLTSDRTWTLPDASGNICLDTGNCAGLGGNIGGSGTANYLVRWNSQYVLENGTIFDNGNVGIGTTNPTNKLDVVGTARVSGATTLTSTLGVTGATTLSSTLGVTGTTSLGSTLAVTGATTLSSTLSVTGGGTFGGNVTVNGNGHSTFAGEIGIGTTNPLYKLDVSGGTGIVGQFSGRVIGGNAVNPNEFVTLSQVQSGSGPWSRSSSNVYLTTSSDKVGIGTSSATQLLHLTSSSDTAIRFEAQSIGGATSANTSAGPSFGTTGANDNSIGSTAWTSPQNAVTDDSQYATATINAGTSTNYVKVTGFGFAIPSNATILGIIVEWKRSSNNGANTSDKAVRIIKGGTIGSTDKSTDIAWSVQEEYDSYGGASDLWGQTWTPADINASTFGAALAGQDTHSSQQRTLSVNAAKITVYYATPAGGTINWAMGSDHNDSGKFKISNGTTVSGGNALTIDTLGNIGIGTITPSYKVDVIGGIRASNGLTISSGTISLPNTSIANAALQGSGALTVTPGTGLSGGGSITLGSSATLNLANTAVSAGSYGTSGASFPTFTVDAQGRLTAAGTATISSLTTSNLSASAAITNSQLANSSITIANGTNISGGSSVSLGGTVTLATVNNPTFSTSVTSPLIIGGSTSSSGITLQSTTGTGSTDYIKFLVGNNGATEAMRVISSGNIGIGTSTPSSTLDIVATGSYAAAGVSGINTQAHTVTMTGATNSTYATFRAVQIGAMTLTGSNNNQTVTTASSLYVATPVAGTRMTITNNKPIDTQTGAYLSSGGAWTNNSSRTLKENFGTLDYNDILNKIGQLPVDSWNYKAEDPSIRHIGPFSEDFYELFQVGNDDKHIATLDSSGVALAGVKGLIDQVNTLKNQVNQQQVDLTIIGKLEADGTLVVGGKAQFKDETVFEKLVTFLGDIVFKGTVSFTQAPTFTHDTAGQIVIKKDATTATVTFTTPYTTAPVVTLTETSAIHVDWYRVTNVTNNGFTVEIANTVADDINFNWIAIAVPATTPTPTPTATPLVDTPTPTPAVTLTPSLSPTPSSTDAAH